MGRGVHAFHIPVMGTGFSIDSPIRVGHFGISSVISIIDDVLLERIREYYHHKLETPFKKITRYEPDSRARRITAYLETVQEIVQKNLAATKELPFGFSNDKEKYFALLPDQSPLKLKYHAMTIEKDPIRKAALQKELTDSMVAGSIDVNIMTKLDRITWAKDGKQLGDEFTDAKAALRGYAQSTLDSCLVFSAGLNQSLFNYMTQFRDFYRNEMGEIKKKVILKVSDFRSSFIQGKILAKKGIEVHEFRIESGLNCGGHAFASNGYLLPSILKEFREKRHQIAEECRPMVKRFYETMGWGYPENVLPHDPLVTVQGGIGTHGEAQHLMEEFNVDRTGWGTPFLLVPEATAVDKATQELLIAAKEEDCYLSPISPLGVPFNTVRNTGSLQWTREQVEKGNPGSPCPKGYLVSNTEFTAKPICTASREFQSTKLDQIATNAALTETEKMELREKVYVKTCLCDHLGNSALVALGLENEKEAPPAICPGPNIAWFNRIYSLQEMVDHIYGRGISLVPAERPHMFAKEIEMYVDYFAGLVKQCTGTAKELLNLTDFVQNLREGMNYCLELAADIPRKNENLASIPEAVEKARLRLEVIWEELETLFPQVKAA